MCFKGKLSLLTLARLILCFFPGAVGCSTEILDETVFCCRMCPTMSLQSYPSTLACCHACFVWMSPITSCLFSHQKLVLWTVRMSVFHFLFHHWYVSRYVLPVHRKMWMRLINVSISCPIFFLLLKWLRFGKITFIDNLLLPLKTWVASSSFF